MRWINERGLWSQFTKNRNEFLLSHVDIHKVANHVKPFPLEWIDEKNKKIKKNILIMWFL